MRMAWHVVAIHWQTKAKKKLPALDTLLIKDQPRRGRGQTVTAMRSALAVLSAQHGIPLQKRKKKKKPKP